MIPSNKNQKEEREKILKGLRIAWKKLLESKKRNNRKLVVMRNNKIVWIDPEDA